MTTSCSDFLKEYSQDLSRVKTYTDLDELLIGGAYLQPAKFTTTYSYGFTNKNYLLLHFMGDELQENSGQYYDPDATGISKVVYGYYLWQKNVGINKSGQIANSEDEMWNLSYNNISVANMVIKAVDELNVSKDADILECRRVKGEAHFLRAVYYYMLANLYGKPYDPATAATNLAVPIKLTEYIEDKEYVRNSVKEVYESINSDLDKAEEYLSHITTPKSYYRAGLNAVYLFRSRVYLYMQEWEKAQHYAEQSLAMNSSILDLKTISGNTFALSGSSPELIFTMGGSILANLIFASPGGYDGPMYHVSDYLYDLYDEDDYRKKVYVTTEYDTETYKPTLRKIDPTKANMRRLKEASDCFLLRSSEAYLNLAEAAAMLGKDDIARQQLKTLRDYRVSIDKDIELSGDDLITFIREERFRELCYEGHRWFDLRRYTVCNRLPYSKVIEHAFTTYQSYYKPIATNYYRLEEYDEAYTLDLPKEVKSFQLSIGSNERPDRPVYRSETY